MKDIVIKEKHIKRELWIFAACIAVMEILNIYSIIKYHGMWKEAVMSLGFVVAAAVVTYLVVGLVRLIVAGIIKLIKKN
jgi:ABC-type proline/glycine betaine transport system permease subunit